MQRQNKIYIFLGTRNSGKTYYYQNILLPRLQNNFQKILVIDTFEHPKYADYQTITVDMLSRWKSGKKRIVIKSLTEVATALDLYIRNTLIVFEDSTKYFRNNLPDVVYKIIYDSKQKNNDLLFMYHGFKKIPPEFLDNANYLFLFKMVEKIKKYEHKIPDFEIVEPAWMQVQNSKEEHPCKIVTIGD